MVFWGTSEHSCPFTQDLNCRLTIHGGVVPDSVWWVHYLPSLQDPITLALCTWYGLLSWFPGSNRKNALPYSTELAARPNGARIGGRITWYTRWVEVPSSPLVHKGFSSRVPSGSPKLSSKIQKENSNSNVVLESGIALCLMIHTRQFDKTSLRAQSSSSTLEQLRHTSA